MAAEPRAHARWSNDSALTTPKDRVELALLGQSSWAPTDWLELGTQPLATLIAPHLDAKLRWLDHGKWHVSSAHGLLYPSLLLGLVAKEGTLGLLPADANIPQALIVDNELIATLNLQGAQWLSLRAGALVAPRSETPILLDFPFLYQRLSALNANLQPALAVAASGRIAWRLDYELSSRYRLLFLDEVSGAFSWESNARLGVSLSGSWRLSAGANLAYARFPIGERLHWFPVLDVRYAP